MLLRRGVLSHTPVTDSDSHVCSCHTSMSASFLVDTQSFEQVTPNCKSDRASPNWSVSSSLS